VLKYHLIAARTAGEETFCGQTDRHVN